MEVLARRLLGPKVVHAWCLSHILRRSGGSGAVGESAGPLRSVHNDFTEEYGDVVRKLYTTHPSKRGQQLRKMLKQRKGLEFTEKDGEISGCCHQYVEADHGGSAPPGSVGGLR